MPELTPADRARHAATTRWANEPDRAQATANARAARLRNTAAKRDAEASIVVMEKLARDLVSTWPAATVDARRRVAAVLDVARPGNSST